MNSGVILFRLDRMRTNSLYNQLLEAEAVTSLANKYSFKVICTVNSNTLKLLFLYTVLSVSHTI